MRTRWVQELFAFVGIAVGVALVFSAQVANTSITGSVEQLIKGTFGRAELQLTARDPHGFDAAKLRQVRHLPGVKVAAPLLETRGAARGPAGKRPLTLLGTDRSLAQLRGDVTGRYRAIQLPTEQFVALPGPIARAIGVSIGQPFELDIGALKHTVRLNVELERDDIGSLTESPVAIVPLRFAQRLSDLPGRVSRILVETTPGQTAAVQRRLELIAGDALDVRPADFDVQLVRQAAVPTSQSTSLFAAISALVGFLFAFNATLLTLSDRRRLITAL
ncbi:MAG TPA: hypothetical protein VI111_06415, partial [Thermoleophilaceae bacterium]